MKVQAIKRRALLFLGGTSSALSGAASGLTATVHVEAATTKVKASANTNKKRVEPKAKKSAETKTKIVIVKEGDTTWDIAQKHHTTVAKIVKDNDLENGGSLIHINDKLKVLTGNETNKSTVISSTKSTTIQDTQQNSINHTQSSSIQDKNENNYSNTKTVDYQSATSGSEKAAKEWIAARESGGSYTARNASSGAYGRYQLLPGYLHGDYSAANQERVADTYVKNRYGSWQAAQNFWQANQWY